MRKESTNKMNKVITQLKLKGFKQQQNKHNKYCKGALSAVFNFSAEYICFRRKDGNYPNAMEGLDVTNFSINQLLKRMFIT